MPSKFAWVRSITKKKKEEINPDVMVIFGLKFKDHLGNPWFLPTDDGGIVMNYACTCTKEQFETAIRHHLSKK